MTKTDFVWTGEQAAAIQARGHTLLEANAGTGKTTTVIGKILWHLGLPVGIDEDVGRAIPLHPDPCRLDQVAAITFTEKAAYDLKRKLRSAILESDRAAEFHWALERAFVGTIHAFCAGILREQALRLGLDPSFGVMDEMEAQLEQDELIKDLLIRSLEDGNEATAALVRRYGLQSSTYSNGAVDFVRAMMHDIRWHPDRYDRWASGGTLRIESLKKAAGVWDAKDDQSAAYVQTLYEIAADAVRLWEEYQERENALDFDALILKTRSLLDGHRGAAALTGLRRRYRLLIIDEFQDTDFAQRDIAFAIADLAGKGAAGGDRRVPQVFFVGDPKQSIYRFRGADVSVWNDVKQVLCGDDEPLRLTRNFRSDPAVVDFVNEVCEQAMDRDPLLAGTGAGARVAYHKLIPHRTGLPSAGVDWMAVSPFSQVRVKKNGEPCELNVGERREGEAVRVTARIREMVDPGGDGSGNGVEIYDPEIDDTRPCRYSDVAILFRARTGIKKYEEALWEYGVPYYMAGDTGLFERLEILDLVTVLRVLDDPGADLRFLAFLRSPFVGLRDEVIARIKLDRSLKGSTLLQRARSYLETDENFDAPEHPDIASIERAALENGIALVDELGPLRSRWPLDRLLEEILERTGYRTHLWFMEQPEPKLANIQRFLRLLEGYREHTVGSFLELWARWEAQDRGVPQAPLYSREDEVVTLSTIHSAKGLEWPVVFLVDSQEGDESDRLTGRFWSDRELGPVLCPRQDERGARSTRLMEREAAENAAEKARLLYVAMTRARDRLVITGPGEGTLYWHARWLAHAKESVPVIDTVPDVARSVDRLEPELAWLDDVQGAAAPPPLVEPLRPRRFRPARSATEFMARARDRREWELKYRYGVVPEWYFSRKPAPGEPAAWLRGTIIHDVLEHIEELEELADLLDVAIGAFDSPELDERLARGGELRREIEREIETVITSDEWKSYTEGEHHRELPFVHLARPGRSYIGAFDLLRLAPEDNLIVDFKTHDIGPNEVDATARKYRLQAMLYRRAAAALAGGARMRFHFTRANRSVEAD